MKHISELLNIRKQQIVNANTSRQMSLLPRYAEKGSNEWKSFDIVRGDKISSAYSVRMPRKPIAIIQPHHVLRIVYPPARFSSGR